MHGTARAAARPASRGGSNWCGSTSVSNPRALPGYAPDPDFSKLPPFNDLVKLGFGEYGVIRDTTHPIYRELFGMPKQAAGDDDL